MDQSGYKIRAQNRCAMVGGLTALWNTNRTAAHGLMGLVAQAKEGKPAPAKGAGGLLAPKRSHRQVQPGERAWTGRRSLHASRK